jgi:hypothetical protein
MSVFRFVSLSLLCSALAAFSFTGCGGKPKPAGGDKAGEHAHDEHDHPSEGPHKGHLIELGTEEYHAELVHDDATKTVSIYILDSQAKKAVPIAATEVMLNLVVDSKPLQVRLPATPQKDDPENQSSHFSANDEAALEALESPKTTGRLNVTINDKPYTGDIEHHDHDHDHK